MKNGVKLLLVLLVVIVGINLNSGPYKYKPWRALWNTGPETVATSKAESPARTTLSAASELFAATKEWLELTPPLQQQQPPVTAAENAATGTRFPGTKVRDFPVNQRRSYSSTASSSLRSKTNKLTDNNALQTILDRQPQDIQACQKWAVVTTIYEPSEAVLRMGNSDELRDWCMVIVADTKTPRTYMEDAGWVPESDKSSSKQPSEPNNGKRVVFLSVEDQEELAQLVPFVKQTPYRSFARKNIGYLYAVWMGATIIFDFDDDNLVRTNADADKTNETATNALSGTELLQIFSNVTTHRYVQDESNLHIGNNIMARHISISDDYQARAFNPFPTMGASLPDTWPRGLPLSLINDKLSRGMPGPLMLKELSLNSNVAVVQSTCNHDPDVDAIYRLTRPLPFTFDSSNARPMTSIVPPHLYAPYNAQATLHYPKAYWGLYLPMTVTGRVSDIWRSYIVQRLLKELEEEAYLLYSPPIVTQYRNAHDYVGDFVAEGHLYHRTEALLDFLAEWKPPSSSDDTLQIRIEDLWINLYERQYIELEDVKAVQEWLAALSQGGYEWPAVRDHSQDTPDVSQGGVEARAECARRRLLNWEEPVPTMMGGANYGALAFETRPNLSVARLMAEYEVTNPFPHSIDLLCRASGTRKPHELALLIESIQLYWPRCAGRVLLVLDRGEEDFARENVPSWIDVMYSEFDYEMPGRLGTQLFNMYSDQQGRSEYVAIIDSDTALVTPVTPDLIFNVEKNDADGNYPQYLIADTQYQKGMWDKGDDFMFQGDSNKWNFMVTLPEVFPRAMFSQYRAGVEAIHNNEFETTDLWQHFRTTVYTGWMSMSQFCLLGNWMVKHWTDTPFDLRKETDVPSIRYGVHLPYHKGLEFPPAGINDPASFQKGGQRLMADGLCELFCNHKPPLLLQNCSSLCPTPLTWPRSAYFKYETDIYGTHDEQVQVSSQHFKPFREALHAIFEEKASS